jgi:large subunit ribosomal protein L28
MARQCDLCKRGPQTGNQVTIRGKAKYLGGVGTKITGITRRQFKPNLQRVKITVGGGNRTVLCCTRCLRSGAVRKAVQAAPFRLPSAEAHGGKAAAAK